ncbi:MAG: hypothetical protein M3Z96_01605, partial [Pseudomonadota bacterium]|nr:hypothetical protein [Pseudomonadota bacterium]
NAKPVPGRPPKRDGRTLWPGIQVGLRHGDKEEPAAIDVRLRGVDARAILRQAKLIKDKLHMVLSTAPGGRLLARPASLVRRRCIARERDEALVRQWLNGSAGSPGIAGN